MRRLLVAVGLGLTSTAAASAQDPDAANAPADEGPEAPVRGVKLREIRRRAWDVRAEEVQVSFTPDGRSVVVPGRDECDILDLATGDRVLSLPAADPDGPAVGEDLSFTGASAADADGRVYLARRDQTVVVFDPASGQGRRKFEPVPLGERVRGLWYTRAGDRVVGWGETHIHVWDSPSGKRVGHFSAPDVIDMDLSPDGRRILLATRENDVWTLNARTGREVGLMPREPGIDKVRYSPDGDYLLWWDSHGGEFDLVDPAESRSMRVAAHAGKVNDVVFLRGVGDMLLLSGGDDKAIRIWQPAMSPRRGEVHAPSAVRRIWASPDGRHVVAGLEKEWIVYGVEIDDRPPP